jgi:hypothetical protein
MCGSIAMTSSGITTNVRIMPSSSCSMDVAVVDVATRPSSELTGDRHHLAGANVDDVLQPCSPDAGTRLSVRRRCGCAADRGVEARGGEKIPART